jgi:hypothetical protein
MLNRTCPRPSATKSLTEPSPQKKSPLLLHVNSVTAVSTKLWAKFTQGPISDLDFDTAMTGLQELELQGSVAKVKLN